MTHDMNTFTIRWFRMRVKQSRTFEYMIEVMVKQGAHGWYARVTGMKPGNDKPTLWAALSDMLNRNGLTCLSVREVDRAGNTI